MDYFDDLIGYFQKHSDLSLIIRPHPLMFNNFISEGVITKQGAAEIKSKVDDMKNVFWDVNSDYTLTFKIVDALISDFTSLLIEFYLTKKPIIYCGEFKNFNIVGKNMLARMYCISNWSEMEDELNQLSNGNDDKINKFCDDGLIYHNELIGNKIKKVIIEDATNISYD